MSGKFALIIGNTEYSDPGLAQLTAPGKDAKEFARILKDRDLCRFDDVKVLLNQFSSSVMEAIDEFFDQRKTDDLLVLYFSGHGIRDELGSLYLAFKNTIRSRLRATAIKADYIRESMDQSRSKRQVLILDCCNSGAFPQGTKAEVGGAMGMMTAFQGYGRYVLTASDATQFAWEGDQVIGKTENSLFTHFLMKGLEGEADTDGDGKITVDKLYEYAFEQISKVTPKQTPTKSSSKAEGEIILRQITRIEDIKPVALPDDLVSEIEDFRPLVREGAVQRLEKILKGKNIGMARSAIEALEKIIVDENTTRRVAQLATQALESYRQVEQKADAERLAAQKAEQDRLAREKLEAELKAKAETERLAAQKAEEERIALAKAETERKARENAERLAAQKAEEERLAREVEEPRLERERETSQQQIESKISSQEKTKPAKFPLLTIGIVGVVIIAIAFCGFAAIGILLKPGGTSATPAATTASVTAVPTFAGTGVAQGYNGTAVSSVPANLVAACQKEGMLTVIATPPNWANYGEIFADFEATVGSGVQLNSLDPNGGSADELAAIVANKGNTGPQAPDWVDVGYAYGATGLAAGDYQPYKGTYWSKLPATTLGIPTYDPNGMWVIGYYGIMVIETNTAVVQNPPKNWSDLLNAAYKGQVALAGDPQSSNQAIMAVYAAALANGGSLDNAQPGLDFFKKLNAAGNFVPVIAKVGTLAQGATPIELAWNYNALGDQQSLAGNPSVEIDYPSPSIGGAYVQAISAYAPHPNCAKVWMEIIHSDQGQLAWIKGGASVVSEADMISRGAVPADVLKTLPDPKVLAAAVAPTVAQLTTAKTLITGGWMSTVGVAIPTAAP